MAKKKNGHEYPWHELPWTEEVFLDFVNKTLNEDNLSLWSFSGPKKIYPSWKYWATNDTVASLLKQNKSNVDEYFFNLKVNKVLK